MTSLRARPLAHRLLFPNVSHDAQLPSLVSPPELSAELYDVLALSLRAYVIPWWSRISRYDKQFLPHLTRTFTTVIHRLDARIRAAPLSDLVCAYIPAILTQHYRDYRNAELKLGTAYASGASASLPQLFHHLQPHIAVSEDGQLDPEYFRQLIDHILSVCLPSDDYQPAAERLIIREVILKVLLFDIIPKVSQPWFIQKSILDLLQLNEQNGQPELSCTTLSPSDGGFSLHSVLIIFLSAVRAISVYISSSRSSTSPKVTKPCPSSLSHVLRSLHSP